METLDTASDTVKPRPRCIVCGGVAWRCLVRRESLGIRMGYFVCAREHFWSARWFDPSLDDHAA